MSKKDTFRISIKSRLNRTGCNGEFNPLEVLKI